MDVLSPPTPPRWLRGAALQTVLSTLRTRRKPASSVRLEALHIPLRASTDQLLAQAYWQATPAPAVVVLHGVSGSSEASYVGQAVVAGLSAGLHVVALNLRGAGRGGVLAGKMYHAGLIVDLEDALGALQARPQVTALTLLGFSLGGNLALKLAARLEGPSAFGLAALATLSAPFDLAATCRRFDARAYWPFRHHILKGLARSCGGLAPHARLPISLARIERLRSLQAFDEEVTAPMHGFAGAQDYYAQASCGPELHRVRLPTLSIHAADDAIVPLDTLEASRANAPANVSFLWPKHGGHLGFVTKLSELRQNWAIDRSLTFLRQHADGRA